MCCHIICYRPITVPIRWPNCPKKSMTSRLPTNSSIADEELNSLLKERDDSGIMSTIQKRQGDGRALFPRMIHAYLHGDENRRPSSRLRRAVYVFITILIFTSLIYMYGSVLQPHELQFVNVTSEVPMEYHQHQYVGNNVTKTNQGQIKLQDKNDPLSSADVAPKTSPMNASDSLKREPLKDVEASTDMYTERDKKYCTKKPRQVHLAVGKDASTEIAISFAVPFGCRPSTYSAAVIYWLKGDNHDIDRVQLRQSNPESVRQYNNTPTLRLNEFYVSPYFHHIRIDGLDPRSRYSYICVVYIGELDMELRQFAKQYQSSARSFQTAPSSRSDFDEDFEFAIVGDSGSGSGAKRTMDLLYEAQPKLILYAGDVAYCAGRGKNWDRFFERFEKILSSTPFMSVPGNHDVEPNGVTFEVFPNYEPRFAMPELKNAIIEAGEKGLTHNPRDWYGVYDYGNAFYSFVSGPATFIHLNSYTSSKVGSRQYEFLLQALQNVNREETPWVFVMAHCPLYNPYSKHVNEIQTVMMKEAMEPLFIKHRVNIVFSGHIHGFARSKHVAMEKSDVETAPIYIISGDGGLKPEPLKVTYSDTPKEWLASRDNGNNSFGTVRLMNSTHACWKRILSTDGSGGDVWEEFIITNQYHV